MPSRARAQGKAVIQTVTDQHPLRGTLCLACVWRETCAVGFVSGWREASYGLRVSAIDRDNFNRSWRTVTLDLHRGPVLTVPVRSSFWRGCNGLRSSGIGDVRLRKASSQGLERCRRDSRWSRRRIGVSLSTVRHPPCKHVHGERRRIMPEQMTSSAVRLVPPRLSGYVVTPREEHP
jgi:hypothetical protein